MGPGKSGEIYFVDAPDKCVDVVSISFLAVSKHIATNHQVLCRKFKLVVFFCGDPCCSFDSLVLKLFASHDEHRKRTNSAAHFKFCERLGQRFTLHNSNNNGWTWRSYHFSLSLDNEAMRIKVFTLCNSDGCVFCNGEGNMTKSGTYVSWSQSIPEQILGG